MWYRCSTTQIMCVQVFRLRTNFVYFLKFIFMLQQSHNIASGACVPGHGARLITQVYAGPQRLSLASQFTGRSACYMTRVTSLHEAESFTGILPQGSLFPTLIRLLCQCIRLYFKCNHTEIHRELSVKKYMQWTVSQGSH